MDGYALVLQRDLVVPLEGVWRAWTDPVWLARWFTPAPWTTEGVTLDLRPGGRFALAMRSPEGAVFPHEACILAVEPSHRLVWSTALRAGFAPNEPPAEVPPITVIIGLEALEGGTRYTATVLHRTAEDRDKHAAMGFHEGWSAALDQLVALVTTVPWDPEPQGPACALE